MTRAIEGEAGNSCPAIPSRGVPARTRRPGAGARFGAQRRRCARHLTLARAIRARARALLPDLGMPNKIRINLANEQELRELPGIGAPEAATIVRFRAEHGPIADA